MRNLFLRFGSLLALIALALGALGSHALEELLEPERIETFEIGVRYHFYHAFATLFVALMLNFGKKPLLILSGWLFIIGVFLFSGSIYLLALQDVINSLPVSILGPLTPIGGVLFMAGWIVLFLSSFQQRRRAGKKE